MKKYLDLLFLKGEVDHDLLDKNLYISADNYHALYDDCDTVFEVLKVHNSYEILKEKETELTESYQQNLYILNVDGKECFLRLITAYGLIYDALVYTNIDRAYIEQVFFQELKYDVPVRFTDALKTDKPACIIKEGQVNHLILHANEAFFKAIKYADWDFLNKHQNYINTIAYDDFDFSNMKLECSDGEKITLKMKLRNYHGIYLCVSE